MPEDNAAQKPVELRLIGHETEPVLPGVLISATRSIDGGVDVFLPPGYLQPVSTFDVGPSARSSASGAVQRDHAARADEIIVLELADGGTLITSAGRLHEALGQSHPELLDGDTILLEKLRVEGAAAGRGLADALGGLVSKVFTVVIGGRDAIIDAALGQLKNKAELGVSWLGTKALMRAIENQLAHGPGLYRWVGASGKESDLEPVALVDAKDAPLPEPERRAMLVFVHGTGSSTLGSFGELRIGDRDLWAALEARFPGGIFGFEHRTLSESPIENAIQLVNALPRGAHVSLASHSRGGLVADLMCLGDFDALIDTYRYAFVGTGDPDPQESARVRAELDDAHAEQRGQLRTLAKLLRERGIVIRRYVRTAGPANGTLLASGNFDVFLSSMLTLIGAVPFFFGSPIYSAFKRVVIEIARNRTNAHLVPGIEAMLPDSPIAALLRDAPVRDGLAMAVIAGDIQGGNLLKRLGVLLTDFLLFDKEDNDLVVDTPSMLAGIAPKAVSRVLFDRGADVSHFRYFTNLETRSALRDWFVSVDPASLTSFRALPSADEYESALASAELSRDAGDPKRPVVVLLPGVMGSHLRVGRDDRVWFDPPDIATGGLDKIGWDQPGVEADELFAMFYGKVCEHLSRSHRVERFAYDWRQPIDVLAERLGAFLAQLMKDTDAPIRLFAHSMGGLVVRACIHKRRSVMDTLMARDGARLVMLGTPNQGAHSMVANMIGKTDMVRTLVRLDLKHDMQQVLDLVADFRGALQLLPKPGFIDTFQGQDDGGGIYPYQQAGTWTDLKAKVVDFWFGNQTAATPTQPVLDAASWLWTADGLKTPALPAAFEKNSIYVFGVASNTPCGIREETDAKGRTRLKLIGTTRGDGTVTWDSGRIGGIGNFYYQPVQHGDLLSTVEHFPALTELLTSGATALLSMQPPATRAIEQARPIIYDAGPPTTADPDALQRAMMGSSLRNRVPPRTRRRLEVTVKAMDLRFIAKPIMVGHYEQDSIAGAEALIDRELLQGDLSERNSLGLYSGPSGSATVVLRIPNEYERERGSLTGAIVTGLGRYEGSLSPTELTSAVRTGALRYLLQVVDVLGQADREVPLASLLLGFNSSANLTIAASVEALVTGVMEANARFFETTRLNIRIARLDIVELYLDTAITAVYALRQLTTQLAAKAERQGTTLVAHGELVRGDGARQRLFDDRNSSYWPRLIITDADRPEFDCMPDSGLDRRGQTGNRTERDAVLVADRLRFLYVGQRARAESVMQQRQPGLIEALVAQQIRVPIWNEDFGRMLFQLMVPHDFKDAARQLDRVVLVVDSQTANLPWELMLADDPAQRDSPSAVPGDRRPLSLRAAVVRQLSSSRFRSQVRQALGRTALVIGNPSVAGFGAAFPTIMVTSPGLGGATSIVVTPAADPSPLPGAQAEAVATAAILASMGYSVASVIGADQPASQVLSMLYHQPWRILHISAHGVFNLRHADGRNRSGVLLSGGLLITAAEIAAMEIVPDLVFLNCCHLGQIDGGRDGNKLAASVASELIQIGVRCVVVAGWAVNDESAKRFGQVFYEQLLLRRKPFGDAVFDARCATWDANPADITWGAFQAYGDPGWVAEPRAHGASSASGASLYVSPDELLDDLAGARAELARRRGTMTEREMRTRADAVGTLIARRCPPGWAGLPQLHSALGTTWYELNQLERAREEFIAAIRAEDAQGVVPIRDIERLANVEARLGERRAEAEINSGEATQASLAAAQDLIDLALERLDGLDALVGAAVKGSTAGDPTTSAHHNSMRSALRGSAWKRKASLQARRLLSGQLSEAAADAARTDMQHDLDQSIAAYRGAEGVPGSSQFVPYLALNRLALDALTAWKTPASKDSAIGLAQQCRQTADQAFGNENGPWAAIIPAESLLVEHLLKGSLGRDDDTGRQILESIIRAYSDATSNINVKPSELDSIVTHLDVISRLCDALSIGPTGDPAMGLTADRLIELARRIQPGRAGRSDRPRDETKPTRAKPAQSGATQVVKRRAAAKKSAKPAGKALAQSLSKKKSR